MNRNKLFAGILAVSAVLGIMTSIVQANLIINGDFQDTTDWGAVGSVEFPAGWPTEWLSENKNYKNPAAVQTGETAIGGSGTSAYLPRLTSNGGMQQNLEASTAAEWIFEVDIAMEDPFTARSLNMILGWGLGQATSTGILCRVIDEGLDMDGDIQFYNGGGVWVTALTDVVTFDADVTVAHTVHHFKIAGHFDQASPSYDIEVSDSVGTVLGTATGIQAWYPSGGPPAQGAGLDFVRFYTHNVAADALIDNVSLVNMGQGPLPGDANLDGSVDVSDLGILATNYGTAGGLGWGDGDFTGDGAVDVSDLGILATNYGTVAEGLAVPEPSVLLMLAGMIISALCIYRRK